MLVEEKCQYFFSLGTSNERMICRTVRVFQCFKMYRVRSETTSRQLLHNSHPLPRLIDESPIFTIRATYISSQCIAYHRQNRVRKKPDIFRYWCRYERLYNVHVCTHASLVKIHFYSTSLTWISHSCYQRRKSNNEEVYDGVKKIRKVEKRGGGQQTFDGNVRSSLSFLHGPSCYLPSHYFFAFHNITTSFFN